MSEEQRAKHVRIIRRAAHRAERLIEDLLQVAQIEAGTMGIEREQLDVGELVDEAIEAFPQVAERGQQLDCEIAPGTFRVMADRARIHRVLVNLVGNAAKFSPDGGRIVVRADHAERMVRISVSDTGRGIAEEHLARLFEPYWQAKSSDERGIGLGLAIVRAIVYAHGGEVGVASTPGRGSTFFFTVPDAAASEEPCALVSPR